MMKSDTATAVLGSIEWHNERTYTDEHMDRQLKSGKHYYEKQVVILQERKDACTTEKGKAKLDVRINWASSESSRMCEEYFQRTSTRLEPLLQWQLATKKMRKASWAETAAKRVKQNALVDASCSALSSIGI
jgi:hypothetical protein